MSMEWGEGGRMSAYPIASYERLYVTICMRMAHRRDVPSNVPSGMYRLKSLKSVLIKKQHDNESVLVGHVSV